MLGAVCWGGKSFWGPDASYMVVTAAEVVYILMGVGSSLTKWVSELDGSDKVAAQGSKGPRATK